jgi:hypothetical protein
VEYFGDSDIPSMMAAFKAIPITVGVVTGIGLVDQNDEAVQTSDAPDRGIVVLPFSTVRVQTSAFPNCKIDDVVYLDGHTYSVRERKREGDGALTVIFLGQALTVRTFYIGVAH